MVVVVRRIELGQEIGWKTYLLRRCTHSKHYRDTVTKESQKIIATIRKVIYSERRFFGDGLTFVIPKKRTESTKHLKKIASEVSKFLENIKILFIISGFADNNDLAVIRIIFFNYR